MGMTEIYNLVSKAITLTKAVKATDVITVHFCPPVFLNPQWYHQAF